MCMAVKMQLHNTILQQWLLIFLHPGGWPLIGLPNDAPWDINGPQFMMEKLINSPAFFSISVDMDEMNSSRYIITVSECMSNYYSELTALYSIPYETEHAVIRYYMLH